MLATRPRDHFARLTPGKNSHQLGALPGIRAPCRRARGKPNRPCVQLTRQRVGEAMEAETGRQGRSSSLSGPAGQDEPGKEGTKRQDDRMFRMGGSPTHQSDRPDSMPTGQSRAGVDLASIDLVILNILSSCRPHLLSSCHPVVLSSCPPVGSGPAAILSGFSRLGPPASFPRSGTGRRRRLPRDEVR